MIIIATQAPYTSSNSLLCFKGSNMCGSFFNYRPHDGSSLRQCKEGSHCLRLALPSIFPFSWDVRKALESCTLAIQGTGRRTVGGRMLKIITQVVAAAKRRRLSYTLRSFRLSSCTWGARVEGSIKRNYHTRMLYDLRYSGHLHFIHSGMAPIELML